MTNETIFFSYSRDDSQFVLELAGELRNAGAPIWLDQLDISPGNHWDSTIEEALQKSGVLLVVLSKTSVESNNVMDEVSFALEEQKKVVPVLKEQCEIPFRLRRLQHADFREDYKNGLDQLVQSLELTEEVVSKLSIPTQSKATESIRMPQAESRPIQVKEPAMAYSSANQSTPPPAPPKTEVFKRQKSKSWIFPFILLLLILGTAAMTYFCVIPDFLGLNQMIGNSCEAKGEQTALSLCNDLKDADCYTSILSSARSSESDLSSARKGLTKLLDMDGYLQYSESDGSARYFDQLKGNKSREPVSGDILIATAARNVRNGVIGVDEVAERNGDVIDVHQVVLVQETIMSGTAIWIKVQYTKD